MAWIKVTRNASDGISMAPRREGHGPKVTGMLQRIRTLAQRSAKTAPTRRSIAVHCKRWWPS